MRNPEPGAGDLGGVPSRWTLVAMYWMLAYQGFTLSINGIAAPFIAGSFGLDDSGIATLYAWIAVASIGVLILSRLSDRVGRRRVLLACMGATPFAALAAGAARSVVLFAAFNIVLYAAIGATVSGAVVMLTEVLPTARRAHGQAYGGIATALGGGLCLMLMPALEQAGYSWRWLLVLSGMGMVCLPVLAWAIPESKRWERAAEAGATSVVRLFDFARGRYRSRAVPVLICAFLSVMAGASADGWSYYHAVSVVGLSAGMASIVVLVAGGLGLVGFPLGAWACGRFGRVPTVVAAWILASLGALLFYWGPPAGLEIPLVVRLGVGFFGLIAFGNAALVGFRAVSTELFPTSVRATVLGWSALVGALGTVVGQAAIALLAEPLGGLSVVVGYLALLAIPGAAIFWFFADETSGRSLEEASGETDP